MFINKNGLNKITAGRVAGDEVKTTLVLTWDDIIFIIANIAGLLWLIFVLVTLTDIYGG